MFRRFLSHVPRSGKDDANDDDYHDEQVICSPDTFETIGISDDDDYHDEQCGMSKQEFEWRCTQQKRVSRMPKALHMLRIQSDRTRQHFLDDPDALKKWDEYADDVYNTFAYNLQYSFASPLYPPDVVLYRHLMKSKACSKTSAGMISKQTDKLRQMTRYRSAIIAAVILTFGVAAGLTRNQWKKQHTKKI